MEAAGGAAHLQGPSGVDAEVKRNHLSQKNSDPGDLQRPLEGTRGRSGSAVLWQTLP